MHNVEGAKSPTEVFYYYQRTRLQAVRTGKWKLHLPHPADKIWGNHIAKEDNIDIDQPMLFDLENDNGEKVDVAKKHPKVVAKLLLDSYLGSILQLLTGHYFFLVVILLLMEQCKAGPLVPD